jgi:hypothetical protein
MAFSGAGAASGAVAGSAFGPVGTVIGGVAGGLLGGSKKKSVTLDPYAGMTPEQKQAMQLLQQFGATGKLGDFQAGETGDLSGYDFGLSNIERTGGTALEKLMASGTGLDPARQAYEGILGQTFNPDDPSNEFASFNRQLTRATKTAGDELNREAAITGGRFGTGIQKQKADLGAQIGDIQASKLSELYSQLQDRKLSAAQGLTGLSATEQAMNQDKIQAAYTYGAKERDLKNQKAQLAYDDWTRSRDERMSSIDAMGTVLGKGTTPVWGGTTQQYSTPNQFQSFLSGMNGASGGEGGSSLMSLVSGLFNSGANNKSSSSTTRTPSFMNGGKDF